MIRNLILNKLLLVLSLGLLITINVYSQDNVGIGTLTPAPSAILELSATDKGVLLPRLTTSQRNAIVSPANGLIIYNTDSTSIQLFDGTNWISIYSKLNMSLTNGNIFIGNTANQAAQVTMSGNATLSNTGVLTLTDNAVTGAKINLTGNTTGDLMYYDGTDWVVLKPGNLDQVLKSNGSNSAPSWSNASLLEGDPIYIADTSKILYNNDIAGGDLSGNYPNPTVNKIQGITVNNTAPTLGQVLKYDGTQWKPDTDVNNIYTAGNGILINALQISADFAGTGTANTVSRSDHNHTGVYEPILTKGDLTSTDITITGGTGSVIGNGATLAIADNAVTGAKINLTGNTTGDLMYYDGTDWVVLTPGANNQYLKSNGANTAPSWGNITFTETDPIYIADTSKILYNNDIAGGDLSGNYPNPTVNKIQGITVNNTAPTLGQVLKYDGTQWKPDTDVNNIYTAGNGLLLNSDEFSANFAGTGTANTVSRSDHNHTGVYEPILTKGDLTSTDITITGGTGSVIGNGATLAIADNAVTGAKINLTGNTTGDLMYYDGTDWVRLAIGTANQVLQSNGTSPVWASSPVLPTGTDKQTLRYNGTTLEANSNLINDGNFIGIGTTTPAVKLHQDGGDYTGTTHKFTAGALTGLTENDGFDIGIDANGNAALNQHENLNIAFRTNDTERMRIWNDGQIGINNINNFDDSVKVWLTGDMVIDGDLVVTGTIDPIALRLIPQNTAPVNVAAEGYMYYDNNTNTIKLTDGTTWSELGSTIHSNLSLMNNDNTAKEIRLYEPSASGTNYIALKAPALANDVTYTLPAADGTDGQVLKTNGTGTLSWGAASNKMTVTTITTNATIDGSYDVYVGDSSNDITITLPDATIFTGKKLYFKRKGGSNGKVIISAINSQIIDNFTSQSINNSGGGYNIISDGTNWLIIGRY